MKRTQRTAADRAAAVGGRRTSSARPPRTGTGGAARPSSPAREPDPAATAAVRPDVTFLAFAALLFVFHNAWAVLEAPAEVVVGVLDPFAIVAASALVVHSLAMPRVAVLGVIAAATLYVFGRGAHLAADSIHHRINAPIVTLWDERFGHITGVLGWIALLAAFCLAERAAQRSWKPSPMVLTPAALLLGVTTFTATVEGQTWWLQLIAAALFSLWALRAPRPLLRTVAAAFVLGALLILGWAAVHHGVPELTAV